MSAFKQEVDLASTKTDKEMLMQDLIDWFCKLAKQALAGEQRVGEAGAKEPTGEEFVRLMKMINQNKECSMKRVQFNKLMLTLAKMSEAIIKEVAPHIENQAMNQFNEKKDLFFLEFLALFKNRLALFSESFKTKLLALIDTRMLLLHRNLGALVTVAESLIAIGHVNIEFWHTLEEFLST